MKNIPLAFVLLCLSPVAEAKLKTPSFTPPPTASDGAVAVEDSEKVLRLQVDGEYAGMKHSADFLIENANQCNHVQGGEKAFAVETKAGKGVEMKKWGFIVNALAVESPAKPGRVSIQLQVEISGPVQGKDGVDVQTWQLQTTLHVAKGKPKVVSRGAGKITITVTDDSEAD